MADQEHKVIIRFDMGFYQPRGLRVMYEFESIEAELREVKNSLSKHEQKLLPSSWKYVEQLLAHIRPVHQNATQNWRRVLEVEAKNRELEEEIKVLKLQVKAERKSSPFAPIVAELKRFNDREEAKDRIHPKFDWKTATQIMTTTETPQCAECGVPFAPVFDATMHCSACELKIIDKE